MDNSSNHLPFKMERLYKESFKRSLMRLIGDHVSTEGNELRLNVLIGSMANHIDSLMRDKSRHYHTVDHLDQMTAEIIGYFAKDLASKDLALLVVATAFHDVVYDVTTSTSEDDSAAFMKDCLENIVKASDMKKLMKLVMATKGHSNTRGIETIMCDADLSGLGYDWETFSNNSVNIAREFYTVTRTEFLRGRMKFFEDMLSRKRIFATAYFKNKYEKKARKNMRQSIKEIKLELVEK